MRKALPILIPAEKERVLNKVVEEPFNLIHNIEGVHLFCFAYDSLDAKNRKLLIKNLKGKTNEILAYEENEWAFLILVKILQATDDTTLIKKTVLSEINKNVEEIFNLKHYTDLMSSIYSPKCDLIEKHIPGYQKNPENLSKKDDAIRRAELVEYTIHEIVNYLSFNLEATIKNPATSKFVFQVSKAILD
mmetsp:Transcript_37253/g.33434  ORF Transcript_37253/g.33434 Transcript_37253/m.33434 type:complete len:190 (+) Transcript_37253:214-783(+)